MNPTKEHNKIKMILLFITLFVVSLSYVMTINSTTEFYQNAFLFIAPCSVEAMDYFFLKDTENIALKIFSCLLMFVTACLLLFFVLMCSFQIFHLRKIFLI